MGSRRVVARSARRVDNPHCGCIVDTWIPQESFDKLQQIIKQSDRFGLDVLKLAVDHRLFFPNLYNEIPKTRQKRVAFRVTLRYKDTLTELAWESRLSRSHWISSTLEQFLSKTTLEKVIDILKNGQDVVNKILED